MRERLFAVSATTYTNYATIYAFAVLHIIPANRLQSNTKPFIRDGPPLYIFHKARAMSESPSVSLGASSSAAAVAAAAAIVRRLFAHTHLYALHKQRTRACAVRMPARHACNYEILATLWHAHQYNPSSALSGLFSSWNFFICPQTHTNTRART